MNLHQILRDPDHKYFIAYGVDENNETSFFIIKSTAQMIGRDMQRIHDMMYETMALNNVHTTNLTPAWIDTADSIIANINADYGIENEEDDGGF